MPQFAEIAQAMGSQAEGWKTYEEGKDSWLVAYRALPALGLSVAVGGDRSSAVRGVRRLGWAALVLFSLFGLAMVAVLTRVARGTARSIEKVTEGAVAIAGGKLDQRIEVRSSDETRLLAESFNIMTDRLREQIARETESRQFESFMRLSAMLTHDLKNAIASLSLLVGNMQRQFHRAEFREDAMKSLTEATNKLRALVSKLSEPVLSLSSEHQLPRPTELVDMIRRVLNATVEPVKEFHQIEIKLPETLVATVEADRIEKVFENLIINALEAMGSKSGKLVVKAGPTENDEVFFLVSDTGPGMTEEFKRTKLFRAFATTKKSGVGLGLYTCREIVRTHGGHIDVESKRGSGTTFRVVLPSEPKIAGRPWKDFSGRR
jgi:signal transduction histidine kinase